MDGGLQRIKIKIRVGGCLLIEVMYGGLDILEAHHPLH